MRIDFYDFGRIKIDGKTYEKDVVIFPDRVFSPWLKRHGHYIDIEEISSIPNLLKEKPELVIIGTGYNGMAEIGPGVEEFFKSKEIEVIIKKTFDAWKIYNELSRLKKTIALFHLTC